MIPQSGLPFRVLHLEDDPTDAELVRASLKSDATVSWVKTKQEFLAALDAPPALILSDYRLPAFSGLEALAAARRRAQDVPFIFVSGTIDAEKAAEVIRLGADDYVLKDHLERLPHAVAQVLALARERAAVRETRDALATSEERFRLVVRATTDTIYDWNLRTGETWWNENLGPMFAFEAHEPGSRLRWWAERVHLDDRRRVVDSMEQAVRDRARRWSGEYRFRRGDEKYARVLDRGTILYGPSGAADRWVGSMMDVTEARRLQEQFLQAQKMEAVGRLAGGVAHDFNNLLTVINGYSELLLTGLSEGDPARTKLKEIYEAGRRAAALTRQLLTFSRRHPSEARPLDLGALVAGVERMLARLVGEDIELSTHADPGLWPVLGDAGQLEQVIVNLVVNARDAMPSGGKLALGIRNVELAEEYIQGHSESRPGPHVLLSISDTGCGMDAEVLSHLFEPFYTTKEAGKGTGLGLSTVYGIVKQAGGHLGVYSEVGCGTTFKVYLPRYDGPKRETRKLVKPASAASGSATILLAEDSEVVRRLATEILKSAGYEVLAVPHGEAGLRALKDHSGKIDLLITDTVMPGLQGPELALHATRSRPEIKVLFVSGYAERGARDQGLPADHVAFLEKPFTAESLTRKVREVLATERTA